MLAHTKILSIALVFLGAIDWAILAFMVMPKVTFESHSRVRPSVSRARPPVKITQEIPSGKAGKKLPESRIKILPVITLSDLELTFNVKEDDESPERHAPWRVYFAEDSAAIEDTVVLWKVLGQLRMKPETRLSVRGYSDNRGGVERTLEMSVLRAEEVKKWLLRHGVARHRIKTEAGGYRPLYKDPAQKAKNRRVEFSWRREANLLYQ